MTDERTNEQIAAEAIEKYDFMIPEEAARRVVVALAAAGRLVTPEHDAQVADLEGRIVAALAEMDQSMYGDPEAVFRMRGRLDPERKYGQFGATYLDGTKA